MGNKLAAVKNSLDKDKVYKLEDGIASIKENAFVKFDETMDIALNLGVDPKYSDQMVRGMVSLPAGIGKDVRVAVICKDEKVEEAKAAGADFASSQSLIDDIKAGKIDFDVLIATPDMMGLIGQVARILGPKGLMPNPKLGTVSADIKTAVKNAKSGQVEYRVEKAGIVHAGLGKLSFSNEDLISNIKAFVDSVVKAKPSGAKGTYLKKVTLSSTMGVGHRIDLSEF